MKNILTITFIILSLTIKSDESLTIHVTGKQFEWSFNYPNKKVIKNKDCHIYKNSKLHFLDDKLKENKNKFLTVPEGTEIIFKLKSEKVEHCLGFAKFAKKKSCFPDKETELTLSPMKSGKYMYACYEFCGIDHTSMIGYMLVVSKEDYQKFIETK